MADHNISLRSSTAGLANACSIGQPEISSEEYVPGPVTSIPVQE